MTGQTRQLLLDLLKQHETPLDLLDGLLQDLEHSGRVHALHAAHGVALSGRELAQLAEAERLPLPGVPLSEAAAAAAAGGGGGGQRAQLLLHVLEELGEAEEAGLDHGVQRLQALLLRVERVQPEEDALAEVAAVGVDGAAVSDVVGCVGVGGSCNVERKRLV